MAKAAKAAKKEKKRWMLPLVMVGVAALVSLGLGLILFLCSMAGMRLSDYSVF